jgi:UDP-N-acetylmuramoyl-L-alanyl-D-glutamate--2,6-diaminopimelate ligase
VPTPPGLRPSSVAPRRLGDLAARLSADLEAAHRDAVDSVTVSGVSLDSRAVRPGDLFAALPGSAQHGSRFAATVAEAGAVALLTDAAGLEACAATGLPVLVVEDPRAVLGDAAAWVYGHPARRLLTLGITGTNGKTTTSFLAESALRALGRATGLIGTVETRVLDERIGSVRTTPEAPDLHGLLAVMVERGAQAAVLEVSSHALCLHRVDGLTFDVAGFTNLSQDHLDFHPTMEDYFRAKASLFTPRRARRGVICVDDVWGRRLASEATIPVVTVCTTGDEAADWTVSDPHPTATGTTFTLRHRGGRALRAGSPLPGEFNIANAALAIVLLVAAGFDAQAAATGVAGSGMVPGRMERVAGGGAPGEPVGIVDYAHTPDAVAAALAALRPAAGRPLVAVLGAGGDRDRGKRPAMGLAAAQVADVVVVTDDNPRSEDPATIRAAVLEGARGGRAAVLEVGGRREAIARAVAAAWGGGTVFLAGKGHEQGQEVAGRVHPFDDREALHEELIEAGRRRTGMPGPGPTEIREESST